MNYISTRGLSAPVNAEEAIINGLASDGGLYVPERIPQFTAEELQMLKALSYTETALLVLKKYLDGFDEAELRSCIEEAYSAFDADDPAPLTALSNGLYVLELWHGPTCAFKDMALQLMPRLLSLCRQKVGMSDELHILVATSGDTGKAALEGFRDVPGTRITVFYPRDGVSMMQKAQMVTQRGENVCVCAVNGNFDDAQTAVKTVFADRSLVQKLQDAGTRLSSANSINWGRLLPQIVYYVRTAFRVYDGEPVSFAVPTGNFGNILAAYYAKRMGAPIGRLLCASNENNVLTDFITTGCYDRRRPLHKTISPSMDILVSSNLERLLYHLSGSESVCVWMESLKTYGCYTVPADVLDALHTDFDAIWCSDDEARAMIADTYKKYGYLIDTHTAVAMYAASHVRLTSQTVVVSTASPFKFARDILTALGEETDDDGFDALDKLSKVSGLAVPHTLAKLSHLMVRFTETVDPQNTGEFLISKFCAAHN